MLLNADFNKKRYKSPRPCRTADDKQGKQTIRETETEGKKKPRNQGTGQAGK